MKGFLKYIKNIFIAIDQLVNAIFYGDPDETISSRVGKHYGGTWLEKCIDGIFFWQENHSRNAVEKDEGKDAILK